jgi:hypothetical protein
MRQKMAHEIQFFVTARNTAELYTETAERVYTYVIHPTGELTDMVNNRPVGNMPVTPKTRKLARALDRVISDIVALLNTSDKSEFNRLFYKITGNLT